MADEAPQKEDMISLKEFFEDVPPGKTVSIKNIVNAEREVHRTSYPMSLPELQLYCETETCNGIRFFEPLNHAWLKPENKLSTLLRTNVKIVSKQKKHIHFGLA